MKYIKAMLGHYSLVIICGVVLGVSGGCFNTYSCWYDNGNSGVINSRKESFAKSWVFTKGAGHSNIILMMLIFYLTSAFSNTTEEMGGVKVDS